MLEFIGNNQTIVILFTFAIVLFAQNAVKITASKYLKVASPINMTGEEIARKIMAGEGITDVKIEIIDKELGDHYDPTSKTVRLSKEIYYGNSVTSQAIAAHEIGHVIQHHQSSILLKIRTAIFPAASIGSKGAWILIFAGFIFQFMGLLWLGIGFFSLTVIFQIATLPVEFDASNRALKKISSFGEISTQPELINGFKKVLTAAAMTYVAATIASVLTLLRLISSMRR